MDSLSCSLMVQLSNQCPKGISRKNLKKRFFFLRFNFKWAAIYLLWLQPLLRQVHAQRTSGCAVPNLQRVLGQPHRRSSSRHEQRKAKCTFVTTYNAYIKEFFVSHNSPLRQSYLLCASSCLLVFVPSASLPPFLELHPSPPRRYSNLLFFNEPFLQSSFLADISLALVQAASGWWPSEHMNCSSKQRCALLPFCAIYC